MVIKSEIKKCNFFWRIIHFENSINFVTKCNILLRILIRIPVNIDDFRSFQFTIKFSGEYVNQLYAINKNRVNCNLKISAKLHFKIEIIFMHKILHSFFLIKLFFFFVFLWGAFLLRYRLLFTYFPINFRKSRSQIRIISYNEIFLP